MTPSMTGKKIQRVALYARVSTTNGKQDTETQLLPMRAMCTQREWAVCEEYIDSGVSGTKESRPALDRMMKDAKRGKFDAVVCWKLDRVGRSLKHLISLLADLEAVRVAFVSLSDNLDLTTPQGRLMFQIIGAMAEFERSLIVERVTAGMARARAKGHLPGRKRQPLDLVAIRSRMTSGESLRFVAKSLAISPALLSRRLKEIAGESLWGDAKSLAISASSVSRTKQSYRHSR
jgi:DNA invertase Pin-like site-specific DNA recombinase